MPVPLGTVGAFLPSRGIGSAPAGVLRSTVRALEEGGFSAVWLGESVGREAFTGAALALGATERLVVGTAIATIFGRDALAAANAARTLAEGWEHRFVLGLGVSHAPMVEDRGHLYRSPLEQATSYLDAVRASRWTGPQAGLPPVLLAALGPRMLAVARHHADGAITYLGTVEHTGRAREMLGPDRMLVAEQGVVVARDHDTFRRSAGEEVSHYLELDNYRRHFRRSGLPDTVVDLMPQLERLFVRAHEDSVAGRIRAHLDAGADHVVLRIIGEDSEAMVAHLLPFAALRDSRPPKSSFYRHSLTE